MKRVCRPLEKYEVAPTSSCWGSDLTLCLKEISDKQLGKLVDFLTDMRWCE